MHSDPSQPVGVPLLRHWPEQAAARLNALIAANAHRGAYAVFDADNTSYHHDLVGSLLPFMEMRGLLTRDTMHPALKLIAFKDVGGRRESLHSYYFRLGEIADRRRTRSQTRQDGAAGRVGQGREGSGELIHI